MGEAADFFRFPGAPYASQEQLMGAIYSLLRGGRGGIGVFESPTGTGKTLSVLCSALTFSRKHRDDLLRLVGCKEQPGEADCSAELPAFLRAHAVTVARAHGISNLLPPRAPTRFFSSHQKGVLSINALPDPPSSDSSDEDVSEIRVIYCSRTHSQLEQVASTLRQAPFNTVLLDASPSSDIPGRTPNASGQSRSTRTRSVVVAARRHLCINVEVLSRAAGVATATTAAATTLKGGIGETSITFGPSAAELAALRAAAAPSAVDAECRALGKQCAARNHSSVRACGDAVADTADIESLVAAGVATRGCPYYASRRLTRRADVILAPYGTALVPTARTACGVRTLANKIVVVDEAHNVADALASCYEGAATAADIAAVAAALGATVDDLTAPGGDADVVVPAADAQQVDLTAGRGSASATADDDDDDDDGAIRDPLSDAGKSDSDIGPTDDDNDDDDDAEHPPVVTPPGKRQRLATRTAYTPMASGASAASVQPVRHPPPVPPPTYANDDDVVIFDASSLAPKRAAARHPVAASDAAAVERRRVVRTITAAVADMKAIKREHRLRIQASSAATKAVRQSHEALVPRFGGHPAVLRAACVRLLTVLRTRAACAPAGAAAGVRVWVDTTDRFELTSGISQPYGSPPSPAPPADAAAAPPTATASAATATAPAATAPDAAVGGAMLAAAGSLVSPHKDGIGQLVAALDWMNTVAGRTFAHASGVPTALHRVRSVLQTFAHEAPVRECMRVVCEAGRSAPEVPHLQGGRAVTAVAPSGTAAPHGGPVPASVTATRAAAAARAAAALWPASRGCLDLRVAAVSTGGLFAHAVGGHAAAPAPTGAASERAALREPWRSPLATVLVGGTISPFDSFCRGIGVHRVVPAAVPPLTALAGPLAAVADADPAACRALTLPPVIPSHHVAAAVLTAVSTPTGPVALRFTQRAMTERGPAMVGVVVDVAVALARNIVGGVCFFFSSSRLRDHVADVVRSRADPSVGLWVEPGTVAELDQVLDDYRTACAARAAAAAGGAGCLLLATMGGRLSEGINLSDHACRAVGIVGVPLPPPDDYTAALSAALSSSRIAGDTGGPARDVLRGVDGSLPYPTAGMAPAAVAAQARTVADRGYDEHAAARVVNQTVGRALRHSRDYASIFFFDERYGDPHGMQRLLSGWVRAAGVPNVASVDAVVTTARQLMSRCGGASPLHAPYTPLAATRPSSLRPERAVTGGFCAPAPALVPATQGPPSAPPMRGLTREAKAPEPAASVIASPNCVGKSPADGPVSHPPPALTVPQAVPQPQLSDTTVAGTVKVFRRR